MATIPASQVNVDKVKVEQDDTGAARDVRGGGASGRSGFFNGMPQPFATVQSTSSFYNEYFVDTDYETDPGVVAMATAEGVEMVQLYAPVTKKRVRWTAERNNEWPVCPSPDTQNANEVLLRKVVTPANPFQGISDKAHRVSGQYVYVMLHGEPAQFPAGTTPAEVATSHAHTLGPNNFGTQIISAAHVRQGG